MSGGLLKAIHQYAEVCTLCSVRSLSSTVDTVVFSQVHVSPVLSLGLLCNCTTSQCEKNGYRCETTGACMASTSLMDGQEQHIRICIDKEKLVPPGQPFFCLSAEGLLNIHCCYTDYCNSLDLKVHSGKCPTH